jgi:hypothetical protein
MLWEQRPKIYATPMRKKLSGKRWRRCTGRLDKHPRRQGKNPCPQQTLLEYKQDLLTALESYLPKV